MEKRSRSLAGIDVLEALSDDKRLELAKRCHWHEFSAHEQIIDRASDSHDVYFVVRGLVRVVNYSYAGREVSYDDIETGGLFGELAAIDGEPRSANVVALADTTVASLSPALFMALLRDNPEIATTIMRRLVQIIRGSTDRIKDLSTLGAANRIYAELVRIARPHLRDDNTAVIRPLPVHSDIASRAGTTRETVARAIGDLARRGLVHKDGHTLVVSDFEALESEVEDL